MGVACGMRRQASGGLGPCGGTLEGRLAGGGDREAETGPSEEFPVVGSPTPFEVVPFYRGGPASADIPSSSACSSTTHSFAPIRPVVTDLEAAGLTRQGQATMEVRSTWTSNPFLLSSGGGRSQCGGAKTCAQEALEQEHLKGMTDIFSSSQSAASSAGDRSGGESSSSAAACAAFGGFAPAKSADRRNQLVEDIFNSCSEMRSARGDLYESSKDIFATAESLAEPQSMSRSGSGRLLYQQAAPVREVPPPGGPLMSFWDVDSRGSAGLNFVFVDDGSVRDNGLWADGAMTSASTTIDSVGLSTADIQLVLSSAMSSRGGGKGGGMPQLCYSLELDTCMPFYDNTSTGGVKDGYPAGPYNVSFDFVSNSFSTDLECAMARQASGGLLHVTTAGPSAPELLSNFLRSTNGETEQQLLAAARGAGGVQQRLVSRALPDGGFLDMPSFDNRSRTFSDSDLSEAHGTWALDVAALRSGIHDRVHHAERGKHQQLGLAWQVQEKVSAEDWVEEEATGARGEEEASGGKAAECAGCAGVESVDSAAKPPRMKRGSMESRQSLLAPEIEAVEGEERAAGPATSSPGRGGPSRSQLYDSSRSWVSHLSGSGRNRHACGTSRSEPPGRGGCDQGRLLRAVGRLLGKWTACFKPAPGRLLAA
eukprot:evm.model.scf_393EXC.5 EVM.evm.TU.scf_393EXC.5   scf_393EXC:41187-43142(+)